MQDGSRLVGDIGGTNARLACARVDADGTVALTDIRVHPVAAHPSLDAAVAAWLAEASATPSDAVFAIAGPTGADTVRFTNNPWVVSASALRARFGFASVTLVNDFAAQARAVPVTPPDRFETLLPGTPVADAPLVVLGPGTGLGLAILVPQGRGWQVLSTEAGHQAFAPRDAEERRLLDTLGERRDPVSYEDLISGRGVERLYRTLAAFARQPTALADAAAIGRAAVAGSDAIAVRAAQMLAGILATFAGNAVLASGAKGGCVIAGGVAEALAPFLRTPEFRARFRAQGVMSPYVADIPVRQTRNPLAALEGAALFVPTT